MGYDAKWGIVGAHHVSAPHRRDRIWIVGELANSTSQGLQGKQRQKPKGLRVRLTNKSKDVANSNLPFSQGARQPNGSNPKYTELNSSSAWWGQDPAETPESNVGRMAHGVAARVDRLKAIGNGQVPQAAALAWKILTNEI